MGEVVGAGLIAHVPTIVLPEEIRRELNNGEDTTLVAWSPPAPRGSLRDPGLRHCGRPGLPLGDDGRVRRYRAGTAQGPVHFRGTAARHDSATLRLSRRSGSRPPDRVQGSMIMGPGSPQSPMIICRSSTPRPICGSSWDRVCRTSGGFRSACARPLIPRTTSGWAGRSAMESPTVIAK